MGAFLQTECQTWRVCEMGVDGTVSRLVEVAGKDRHEYWLLCSVNVLKLTVVILLSLWTH